MSLLRLERLHQSQLEQLTGSRYATMLALAAAVRDSNASRRGRPLQNGPLVMVVPALMKLRMALALRSLEALTGIDSVTVSRCVNRVMAIIGQLPLAGRPAGALIVDTTSCRVATSATNAYSGHKHQRCAKVQVLADTRGMIHDVSDAHAGAVHDKTVWNREAGRVRHLLDQLVLADKAYAGASGEGQCLLRPIKRGETAWRSDKEAAKRFNSGLSKVRVRIEHAFARLKTWRVLGAIFPYRWQRLGEVTRVIAVIHNIERQHRLVGDA